LRLGVERHEQATYRSAEKASAIDHSIT